MYGAMNIYDVIYNENIYHTIDVIPYFDRKELKEGEHPPLIEKADKLEVICLNSDNEFLRITDEAFMFRFVKRQRS